MNASHAASVDARGSGGPKISVLMPVYNGERYLDEALDSVLAQDFADFEVVVVDDGSTDGTAKLLRAAVRRDARVRTFSIPNAGIVAALNHGLCECRGEYIARMDADDVCLPDRFGKQAAYLDEHPSCVLVGGFAQGIDAEGNELGRVSAGPHATTDLTVFPPRVALSIHPLVMLRRAAILTLDGYRGDFAHAEDYDLFLRLQRLGSIDNPDWIVLKYRRHEAAVSQSHLEVQERAAALCEMDAIRLANVRQDDPETVDPADETTLLSRAGVSRAAFDAYVAYRIWRRRAAGHLDGVPADTRRVLASMLTLRAPTLADASYTGLRLRMAGGVLRHAIRTLASRTQESNRRR